MGKDRESGTELAAFFNKLLGDVSRRGFRMPLPKRRSRPINECGIDDRNHHFEDVLRGAQHQRFAEAGLQAENDGQLRPLQVRKNDRCCDGDLQPGIAEKSVEDHGASKIEQ